jgi:ornithine--oxo-acid transaminase
MDDLYIDFIGWLERQQGRAYDRHREHVNPAFVQMLRTIGFDKQYARGEGCHLWDAEGNRYLDLLTGWGAFAIGRNHPKVKAILKQLLEADTPNVVPMACGPLAGLVAERLFRHAGGDLSRVYFCNSGAETVEAALKLARAATGRQQVVYCRDGFHGLTAGALSVTGTAFFRDRFGEPAPGGREIPFGDVDALERALSTRKAAAFIVEPVQGKTCQVVPDGFLRDAQDLCRRTGALLIADEVQTGLGRTGRWFAYQHWPGVEPDLVCVAKALSGGYVPVGAVLARPRIMDAVFDSMERCVVHSSTFAQNDLAMAAALATLQVIEDERLVENAAAMGDYAMGRLLEIARDCPFLAGVRGKGLLLGLDFARPAGPLKLQLAWDALQALSPGLFGQMIVMPLLHKHRVLTQVAGPHTALVKLLPALAIGKPDLDWFLDATADVLAETRRVPGAAWDTVMDLARRGLKARD